MDYLFPNEEICEQGTEALFALINQHLPTAKDMVDGTDDSPSDVQIDYAQDIIEQARDVLVSRGEVISVELRLMLNFLDWRTPAEKAQQQAQTDLEDQARFTALQDARARLKPFVEAFKLEAESFLLPLRSRRLTRLDEAPLPLCVEVKVGNGTGAKFIEAKQRFEQLLGEPVKVSYVGSRGGITVEEDPNLNFTLHLPVRSDGRFYAMVRNLVCSTSSSRVIVRFEDDLFGVWEMVTEPFETRQRNSAEWKEIQALYETEPHVFA